MNMSLSHPKKRIILFFLVIIFFIELMRTAWITDDAIITLRTVLNFINGYGAVFNIGERVQAYTHPLWFLLISIVSIVIKNVFIATLFLCFITTLCTLFIWFNKLATNILASLIAMEVLIFSKAFVDFSTSGLENPLSHLLLVIAIIFVLKLKENYQPLTWYSYLSVCSCIYLTRPDLVLIFVPLTVAIFIQYRINYKSLLKVCFLAVIPTIVWSLFAVLYYGTPFPNTAYAKLGAGIGVGERIHQGIVYFLVSFRQDPITLSFILLGMLCSITQAKYYKLLTLGVMLYLCYIVSIGGDFMAGRFFTIPLLICLILITITHLPNLVYIILALLACKIGLDNSQNTLFSNKNYQNSTISKSGIADERGIYFQSLGLISNNQSIIHWNVPKWQMSSVRKVKVACGLLGIEGLKGGPDLYIIDQCALSDPLLARLPAKSLNNWRIGHLYRQLPDGYFESVVTQKNLVVDPEIKELYSRIKLITQGELFSFSRLRAIFDMNIKGVGKMLTHVYKDQFITYNPVVKDDKQFDSKAFKLDTPLQSPDNLFFMDKLLIKLAPPRSIKSLDLTLSYFKNGYRVDYLTNNHIVYTTLAKPPIIANTPLLYFKLDIIPSLENIDEILISSIDEEFKSGHYFGNIKIN